jgi:hypothetical protein
MQVVGYAERFRDPRGAADVVGVHVRVRHADHARAHVSCGVEVGLRLARRIDDQGFTVAHEEIPQRPLPEPVELNERVERARRIQRPGHHVIHPRRHAALEGADVEPHTPQVRRHGLARVAVPAYDGHRPVARQIDRRRIAGRQELGAHDVLEPVLAHALDAPRRHTGRRAHVEHSYVLATLHRAGELFDGDLGGFRWSHAGHNSEVSSMLGGSFSGGRRQATTTP